MEPLKLSHFAAETHLLACYAAQFVAVDSVLASVSALAWMHWLLLISKNVMFLSFMDVMPYMNQWPNLADYNNKGKAVVERHDESDADDGDTDDTDDGYEDPDDDDDSSDDDDGVDDSDDEDEDSDEDDIGGGGGDDDDEDDDDDNDNDDDTSDEEGDDDEEDDEDAPPYKKLK